jgi:hypothetical protein
MPPSAHRDIHRALLDRDLVLARLAIAEHYIYALDRLFSGVGVPIANAEDAPVGVAGVDRIS